MTANPFDALGLPARPDLTDEQVRAAWRKIAAATHPDRSGGGDVARYTAAAAAYAQLRTGWGRSEAFADLSAAGRRHVAASGCPRRRRSRRRPGVRTPVGPRQVARAVRYLPARIRHGRPLRLLIRALAAGWLSLAVLHLIPGQPAAPALVTGLITWFALDRPRRPGTPAATVITHRNRLTSRPPSPCRHRYPIFVPGRGPRLPGVSVRRRPAGRGRRASGR